MEIRKVIASAALSLLVPLSASAATASMDSSKYADWWKISATSAFSVTTDNSPDPLDTQLFLFDTSGHGITFNDDDGAPPSGWFSTVAAGPGSYLLAVTVYNSDPVTALHNLIFDATINPTGPVSPTAIFAGWDNSNMWDNLPSDAHGTYALDLTGQGTLEFDHSDVVTPEPASMTLFGTGLFGLAGRAWKRRKR